MRHIKKSAKILCPSPKFREASGVGIAQNLLSNCLMFHACSKGIKFNTLSLGLVERSCPDLMQNIPGFSDAFCESSTQMPRNDRDTSERLTLCMIQIWGILIFRGMSEDLDTSPSPFPKLRVRGNAGKFPEFS